MNMNKPNTLNTNRDYMEYSHISKNIYFKLFKLQAIQINFVYNNVINQERNLGERFLV